MFRVRCFYFDSFPCINITPAFCVVNDLFHFKLKKKTEIREARLFLFFFAHAEIGTFSSPRSKQTFTNGEGVEF